MGFGPNPLTNGLILHTFKVNILFLEKFKVIQCRPSSWDPGWGGRGWVVPLEVGRPGLQVSWPRAAGSTTPRALPRRAAQQLVRVVAGGGEVVGQDCGDVEGAGAGHLAVQAPPHACQELLEAPPFYFNPSVICSCINKCNSFVFIVKTTLLPYSWLYDAESF